MPYIGNTVETQGFAPAIDYFNGNGATVTFTLSRPVASVAQLTVVVDNVIQNPDYAFTVAGNAITFTSAPLSGTNNIWIEYTSLVTTYAAISQDPSVVGDITASGGFLAVGDFGNAYEDGTIVDYVTGISRITTGPSDGITLYNGGTAGRTALMTLTAAGNVGIGTVSPGVKLDVVGAANVSGNLAFNSGYGSAATVYGCRAWVNFNGTGTVSIRASGNVSSITDNGTGDYTVNFTNAMPDANYSVTALGNTVSGFLLRGFDDATPRTSSLFRVVCFNLAGSTQDSSIVTLAVFR